jgi:hypothetical protein
VLPAPGEAASLGDSGRLRVQNGVAHGDRERDDDPLHSGLIEEFRRREGLPKGGLDETGQPYGLSAALIKYGGLLNPCPSSTKVDQQIDETTPALNQGWRTAYGIASVIRVGPEPRTWDGVQITEALSTQSNTCPEGLLPSPCAGSSTFTVGQARHSRILGDLAGLRNRFYDFHATSWRGGSLLHDPTRNPKDVNSCQVVCDQQYSCEGKVIGKHTITRTLTKGVHNGQPVTIVNATKS